MKLSLIKVLSRAQTPPPVPPDKAIVGMKENILFYSLKNCDGIHPSIVCGRRYLALII